MRSIWIAAVIVACSVGPEGAVFTEARGKPLPDPWKSHHGERCALLCPSTARDTIRTCLMTLRRPTTTCGGQTPRTTNKSHSSALAWHVALCDDLFDFATIVAEACLDCGDELLPAFVSRRDVRVVLDEVGREIAIDRGGLALLPDILDELTIEPLVGFGGGSPGRASARQGASKASIAGRMAISVRELPSR